METVPDDFIEQVLLRTSVPKTDGIRPPAYVPRPQFASLQGHWGQFGKVLARETQPYHMTFNVMSLPHFDCRTFMKQQMVPIEAIVRKKHAHLLHLTVTKCPIVLPQDQLILDEDIKKLQRLFHRS
uniref:PAZ domain-containing protein n=1 Tax=Steinernema glaseri TaxID=37863 RepID=A0A1I7Y3Z7_9BILA